jgi:fructose-bisphosphate aldolase class I
MANAMTFKNLNIQASINTANALMTANKGVLAMDESNPTSNKRFAKFGIPQTAEMRRTWRDLIITTPDLAKFISGAILYDETIRQKSNDSRSFIDVLAEQGIIPGIKVDKGTVNLAGFTDEKITEGLDGLRERLKEYAEMGLRFAKWRAVVSIGKGIPTEGCIKNNVYVLARYAALCQEVGITPIIEPEVLMNGDHSLAKCAEITEWVLKTLFDQLYKQRIVLEGIILKCNMVLPGKDAHVQNTVEEVADATINCLFRCVPAAVPGVAFLSGGQTSELATAHLNEMNMKFGSRLPWALTFSFSRALLMPALEIWRGKEENRNEAQKALYNRAGYNSEARRGQYVTFE